MPILGLSNQWKTREGLLEQFTHVGAQGKWGKIRQLLESLDARPGPTIFVGTSHSQMNFSNRDVTCEDDRTQPFASVDVVRSRAGAEEFCYRVETRRVDGVRPTTEWIRRDLTDTETVVELLLDAIAYAEVPPRRARNEGM